MIAIYYIQPSGNDLKGGARVTGVTEEQEKRAREKAREDQEVFYSTKQEVRKQRYGISTKWKNEYEWGIKFISNGGRNLRLTRDIDRIGRKDNTPVENPKLYNYIFDHGEVDSNEVTKRHIRTLCALSLFLFIGFGSRYLAN